MTNLDVRYDLLQALSGHLRTVATDEFDMSSWDCGTTACAVGHALGVPLIVAQGLTLEKVSRSAPLRPTLRGLKGFEAVSALFGLTLEDCYNLFDSWRYPNLVETTTFEVADRIDNFILISKVTL